MHIRVLLGTLHLGQMSPKETTMTHWLLSVRIPFTRFQVGLLVDLRNPRYTFYSHLPNGGRLLSLGFIRTEVWYEPYLDPH